MYEVWFELLGTCDTIALWKDIERFNVNLLELDDKIYVYGDVDKHDLSAVIEACCERCPADGQIKLKGG